MSVAEAQARIGSAEFAEWMAYYRVEPFGEERADLRNGALISTIAAMFTGTQVDPADFILTPAETAPEPDDPRAETRRVLEALGAVPRKKS